MAKLIVLYDEGPRSSLKRLISALAGTSTVWPPVGRLSMYRSYPGVTPRRYGGDQYVPHPRDWPKLAVRPPIRRHSRGRNARPDVVARGGPPGGGQCVHRGHWQSDWSIEGNMLEASPRIADTESQALARTG
jgi:hypothetical protein